MNKNRKELAEVNITLNGTKITQDTRNLAFEKNSGVDEIVITVDTDESWSYKLDVKYPDKYNVEFYLLKRSD